MSQLSQSSKQKCNCGIFDKKQFILYSTTIGNITKNDSKFNFEYKNVPQIQSNAKLIQKTSEITTTPLEHPHW